MAPPRKQKPDTSPTDLISQDTQSQTSQDLDISAMQGLMEQHGKDVKARRCSRENAIRQDHQQRIEAIRHKIEATVK
nr:hypothetical protein B0A51_03072 [Rachicladosporium sp. CCFEE 5018]